MIPPNVVVPRPPARKAGTFYPDHYVTTHQIPPAQGDPFNTRNIVHPGDFWAEGMARLPGTHHNVFLSIPGVQCIANKFYGLVVAKVNYGRGISRPSGIQKPQRESVNINKPPSGGAYGDTHTFSGAYGDRIPGRDTY